MYSGWLEDSPHKKQNKQTKKSCTQAVRQGALRTVDLRTQLSGLVQPGIEPGSSRFKFKRPRLDQLTLTSTYQHHPPSLTFTEKRPTSSPAPARALPRSSGRGTEFGALATPSPPPSTTIPLHRRLDVDSSNARARLETSSSTSRALAGEYAGGSLLAANEGAYLPTKGRGPLGASPPPNLRRRRPRRRRPSWLILSNLLGSLDSFFLDLLLY